MNNNDCDKVFFLVEDIKRDILTTRDNIIQSANEELLYLYFRIGKCISENATYGNNFINLLSKSLKVAFPSATGFSPRNLSRMKKFYEEYQDLSILPPAVAKLPWTHNTILIDKQKTVSGLSAFG